MEKRKGPASLFLLLIFVNGFASASAASPSRIVTGFVYNVISHLLKRIWIITSNPNTEISGRPQMKFESGYNVETVFEGSKHGIEPFSVEVTPSGELLVLDSVNSNLHRISVPLSKYSRARLVAGSAEGYAGHVDGKPWEAKMNRPKGFAVDGSGNIYIADASNRAIRKISVEGVVTTIALGKWNGGGDIFGPSEEAKLSNDFEVVYVSSCCSLLVVDRGNQAICEIQLHVDDCTNKYGIDFLLGIAVLFAAGFVGYMLALIQRRVRGTSSAKDETLAPMEKNTSPLYQKPLKQSVRPPLIPNEDEQGNQGGLFSSIGNLIVGAKSSISEIFRAEFFKRRPKDSRHQNYYHQRPVQESFKITYEGEPPLPSETRVPTHKKAYASGSKDREKIHGRRQGQPYFNAWDGNEQQHKHVRQQRKQKHRQRSLGPQTCYEQSYENHKQDGIWGSPRIE